MNDGPIDDLPPGVGDAPPPPGEEMDLAKVHGSILREHREPAEGYESVPLWLVALIMALVFWGGLYLAFYSGGFRADGFLPRQSLAVTPLDVNDPAALGRRLYTQNCVLCHQADGSGIPGIYPPLAGSEWVLAHDWRGDNHLVNIVLHGLQGPIDVRGTTYNGAMPGWKFLRDEEIAALLTYIRSEWGNTAPAIGADYVRTLREQGIDRKAAWSQKDLEAIARDTAPAVPPPPTPAPTENP